ncbi:hypothetical protein ACJ41O_007114 [Fusarium nematophilum]
MTRSTGVFQRLPPQKVTDLDLVAVRAKLLDALELKASALVTPPPTNVSSPPSSRAVPPRAAWRHNPGSATRSRPRPHRSSHGPGPRVVVSREAIKRLPAELARLHVSSPLIVSSPSRVALAQKIQAIIPNLDSHILSSAIAAVPARMSTRDCVVSVGGGSAVTLARAVGLRKGIPHICIPTTYSGNETIPAGAGTGLGEVGGSKMSKKVAAESKVLPAVVIYDEDLTMSSPARFSAPSDEDVILDFNRSRQTPKSEDARWSYIHLPGV